jgi:hypothetical protein
VSLIIFGTAFGFVEAAVVYYLRELIKFNANYAISNYKVLLNLGFITFVSPQHSILPSGRLGDVEVTREAATIVMLACISFVTARDWRSRLGAFMVSFACWDLSYYLFLRILDNWPGSFFTRDVFFLIPVTWIGPVITPIVICTAMLILGVMLHLKPSTSGSAHRSG